jgi:hypothetical protein
MFIDDETQIHNLGILYIVDECGETFIYLYDKYSIPGSNPEFWDKNKIIKISGVNDPKNILHIMWPKYPIFHSKMDSGKMHFLVIDNSGQSSYIRMTKDGKQKTSPFFREKDFYKGKKVFFEVK